MSASILPMTVAVLGVLTAASLRAHNRISTKIVAVVAVSSAFGTLSSDPPITDKATGVVTLVEIAGLLLLVCLVARYADTRHAVVLCTVLGVLASTALFGLHIPPTVMEATAQSTFFALGAVAAAAVGGGLRHLETRRSQAVHDARLGQRLQLAADLHDFVAHDVSGVVALAQAAQVIGADKPEKLMPLLQQIEACGLHALGSMDRTVGTLRSDGTTAALVRAADATQRDGHGLDDIADVVDRFRAASRADVRLIVDRSGEEIRRVPHEVASTAHRLVMEALTNVRRHAGTTPSVTVSVLVSSGRCQPALTVSVINDSPHVVEPGDGPFGDRGRHRSTGLEGLAERVRALGGNLEFGVHGEHGWHVTAHLPMD